MSRRISELDEAELGRLQDAVTKAENALYFAGNAPSDQIGKLRREIQTSKQQIDHIEVEWRQKDREAEAKEHEEQVVFSTLVAKETALNPQERHQYGEFLKEEYFTRSDFENLAHFYNRSWDKLTEGGKDQMSHRVWEGVRHGEYKFDELPDVVKEKESKRLHDVLLKPGPLREDLGRVPQKDRADFLSAYDAGDKHRTENILERPCFADHVATGIATESRSIDVTADKAGAKEAMRKAVTEPNSATPEPSRANSMASLNVDANMLASLREAQGASASSPTEFSGPAGKNGRAK